MMASSTNDSSKGVCFIAVVPDTFIGTIRVTGILTRKLFKCSLKHTP